MGEKRLKRVGVTRVQRREAKMMKAVILVATFAALISTVSASCPDNPASPGCMAVNGTCLFGVYALSNALVGTPAPLTAQDCSEGYVCQIQDPFITGCAFVDGEVLCTCAAQGGIFTDIGACNSACGAYAQPTLDDAPYGNPVSTICCLPLADCPEFYEYLCLTESACFFPQCPFSEDDACSYLGANATLLNSTDCPF